MRVGTGRDDRHGDRPGRHGGCLWHEHMVGVHVSGQFGHARVVVETTRAHVQGKAILQLLRKFHGQDRIHAQIGKARVVRD